MVNLAPNPQDEEFQRAMRLALRYASLEAQVLGVDNDDSRFNELCRRRRKEYGDLYWFLKGKGEHFSIDPPDCIILRHIRGDYSGNSELPKLKLAI